MTKLSLFTYIIVILNQSWPNVIGAAGACHQDSLFYHVTKYISIKTLIKVINEKQMQIYVLEESYAEMGPV